MQGKLFLKKIDEMNHSNSVPTVDDRLAPPLGVEQLNVNDSEVFSGYANSCHLSGLPEELVLDFGFNPQLTSNSAKAIFASQRVVMGWHTAKRLEQVLKQVVDRHESAFGFLETDVRKRIRVNS